MKRARVAGGAMMLLIMALAQQGMTQAQQKSMSDEGGRILALEKAWNHALEEKDAKALDMLLANTLVSVDIDGSVASKSEFLASIKAPDYKPAKVVTEQSSVQVYGNAAVVTGTFRVKGMENGRPTYGASGSRIHGSRSMKPGSAWPARPRSFPRNKRTIAHGF